MPTLWGRLVNAYAGARYGWSGGLSARTLTPTPGTGYGEYTARQSRYSLARAYFNNDQYSALFAYAAYLKTDERLYKFIRSIQNVVPRENSLHVAYTYPGTVNTDNLKTGALPLEYANDALEAPLRQGIKWSNLDTQLGAYVRDAALLGDAAWWVVDDPFRRRVRLELLDPDRVKYVERDAVGNVKAAVIEYEYDEQAEVSRYQPGRGSMALQNAKTHTKTLIVDKERFRTFRDGESYAFPEHSDADGTPVSEWDNEYGFVPLKMAWFTEGTDGWGRNSFFGVARRQIDELNDQASILNDSIRIAIAPVLQAKGVSSAAEINVVREDKDSMAVLYLSNPQGSIENISIPLDIAGAGANWDRLERSAVKNMPILSLSQVRDFAGQLSGVAIEQLFGDGVSVVRQTRKNTDPPLAGALQMLVTIGGIRGYDGFAGFNEFSFDNGDMDLRIAERAVIDDTLSKEQRLQILPSVSSQPISIQRLMLEAAGYGDEVIDEVIAEAKAQQQNAVSQISQNDANSVEAMLAKLQGEGQTAGQPQQPVGEQQGVNA